MGFRPGAYATVWSVEDKGNYTDARITISRKDKSTDKYKEEFQGYVRLVGQAHQEASVLQERSRIKINACDVTTFYSKEKQRSYTTFVIFEFETQNNVGNANQPDSTAKSNATESDNIESDDDLPF